MELSDRVTRHLKLKVHRCAWGEAGLLLALCRRSLSDRPAHCGAGHHDRGGAAMVRHRQPQPTAQVGADLCAT